MLTYDHNKRISCNQIDEILSNKNPVPSNYSYQHQYNPQKIPSLDLSSNRPIIQNQPYSHRSQNS